MLTCRLHEFVAESPYISRGPSGAGGSGQFYAREQPWQSFEPLRQGAVFGLEAVIAYVVIKTRHDMGGFVIDETDPLRGTDREPYMKREQERDEASYEEATKHERVPVSGAFATGARRNARRRLLCGGQEHIAAAF